MQWECNVKKVGFACHVEDAGQPAPKPIVPSTGTRVTARSKGASVTASAVFGGVYNLANGVIDGAQCWAGAGSAGQWLQYTFTKVVPVVEVQTQGCKQCDERTLTYSLKCSQDGVNWTDVEGGKIYNANTDRNTIVTNKLATPVNCKAFRIYPVKYQWPAMRSEIIILDK